MRGGKGANRLVGAREGISSSPATVTIVHLVAAAAISFALAKVFATS